MYMVLYTHASQSAKRHLDRFSRYFRAHSFYLNLQNPMLYKPFQLAGQPPKIAHFPGGYRSLSNTWLLGFSRVTDANGISICSAVYVGLTNMTNRQTDRPRYSVCSDWPHLMHRVRAMRPKTSTLKLVMFEITCRVLT